VRDGGIHFFGCNKGLVDSSVGPTCHEWQKTDELLTEWQN
jgi:hypothetical protein